MQSQEVSSKNKYIVIVAITLISIAVLGIAAMSQASALNSFRYGNKLIGHSNHAMNQNHKLTTNATQPIPTDAVTDKLLYMIEEEKLAHDVYAYLNEYWDQQIFANITNSETKHQQRLIDIANQLNIQYPSTNQAGSFVNQDLQALYNTLISEGTKSIEDAYKVGVAIEEQDIADLQSAMQDLNSTDSTIKSAYTALLNGSKHHLDAFNRQL